MTSRILSIIIIVLITLNVGQFTSRFQPISFDLSTVKYSRSQQRTKVTLGVEGGEGGNQFFFDEYPKGWRYVDDSIFIPSSMLAKNRKYPIKVRVVDREGNQARATMVFQVTSGRVLISEFIYPYDAVFKDAFFNTGEFRGRPAMERSGSYYQVQDNLDLTLNKDYIPNEQLQGYKKVVSSLSTISNSTGSGLGSFYKAFRGDNQDGTFSLIKFLQQTKDGEQGTDQQQNEDTEQNSQSEQESQDSGQQNTSQDEATNQQQEDTQSEETQETEESTQQSSQTEQEQEQTQQSSQDQGQGQQVQSKRNVIQIFTKKGKGLDFSNFGTLFSAFTDSQVIQNSNRRRIDIITNRNDEEEQQQRQSDDIFSSLWTAKQMDELILNANGLQFSKLIQQVAESNFQCQQIASYLSVFLGRMRSAISIKNFTLSQLQIVNLEAKKNYERLSKQLKRKQKQIQTLELDKLKKKLNDDLIKIKSYYSQYNKYDVTDQPNKAKIIKIKNNIVTQKRKSSTERQQLTRQKLQYNKADLNVQRIQNLLNQAKSIKANIEKQISEMTAGISQTESTIQKQQSSIDKLQTELSRQKQNLDQLQINISNKQIAVERIRSGISKNMKKQSQLLTQIAKLERKVLSQKKKIVNDQLVKLNDMISGLQNSLPSIQQFIANNYYNCFSAQNLQVSKEGNKVVYIVATPDFQNYIQNVYQLGFDWSTVQLPQRIRFRPISILDSMWQTSYGSPYDIFSYASSKDFSFGSDFNCLNPSSLTSGTGIIDSIGNKFMSVNNDDGGNLKLILGACSRMESTGNMPTVGQRIYWRGVPASQQGNFNVYKASCI